MDDDSCLLRTRLEFNFESKSHSAKSNRSIRVTRVKRCFHPRLHILCSRFEDEECATTTERGCERAREGAKERVCDREGERDAWMVGGRR